MTDMEGAVPHYNIVHPDTLDLYIKIIRNKRMGAETGNE